MKAVFTTGEAARLCHVSQQTIIRCYDNGKLKGFNVPNSRFRRIPPDSLRKFMKDHGIPTDGLDELKKYAVLGIGIPPVQLDPLKTLFARDESIRFVGIGGIPRKDQAVKFQPDLVLVSVTSPTDPVLQTIKMLKKRLSNLQPVRFVALGPEGADTWPELGKNRFHQVFSSPFDMGLLVESILTEAKFRGQ